MKIKVIDTDTKVETIYDYSNDNWAHRYACMKIEGFQHGVVHMWAPPKVCVGGYIITSGRKWMLIE